MRRTLLSLVILFSSVLFLSRVSAEELVIEGNGSGSQNSIVVNSGSSVTNPQSNSFEVITNIDAGADTGGNSASQNNGDVLIQTGNAFVNVSVNNQGNLNTTDPKSPTPTAKPNSPKPTSVPPTSIPSSSNSSNSSPSTSTSSGNSGGSGGVGGAAVLGLSKTSSQPDLSKSAVTVLGLLCMSLALVHLRVGSTVSA